MLLVLAGYSFVCASAQLPPVITPSSVTIAVGETAVFSVTNESGDPLGSVQWSVTPAIAELQQEADGGIQLSANEPGRAVITATVGSQSASASATIVAGEDPATVHVVWSVLPIPGFETVQVLPAWPNGSGLAFYSIEGRRSGTALLRAFNDAGQQLWMRRLAANATLQGFEHTLQPSGEIYLNQSLVSDHAHFILGKGQNFMGMTPADPSTQGLPIDGQTMLIGIEGDSNGGLMLLERGRFRDSLVDIGLDGHEVWRYSSQGRLQRNWTANLDNNVAIVETLSHPLSSALVLLDESTGELHSQIPFPESSSTINGFPCSAASPGVYKSLRASVAGSVMTNSDRNIYVQVETFVESEDVQACKEKQYTFEDRIALLRVTPDLKAEWKVFENIHADGSGPFQPQNRLFASETIPDGSDGVLAAWTMVYAGTNGESVHFEARLSRIGLNGQQDFSLPLIYWTPGKTSPLGAEMVLGENNVLYASNGDLLVRFDPQKGVVDWGRHPPTGHLKILFSTAGGGVLISNAGRMGIFDVEGNLGLIPWTVAIPSSNDIGVVPTNPGEQTYLPPIALRDLHPTWTGGFVGVEDGMPLGHGSLVRFIR